jgi:hypothetical protein
MDQEGILNTLKILKSETGQNGVKNECPEETPAMASSDD